MNVFIFKTASQEIVGAWEGNVETVTVADKAYDAITVERPRQLVPVARNQQGQPIMGFVPVSILPEFENEITLLIENLISPPVEASKAVADHYLSETSSIQIANDVPKIQL